MKTVLSETNLSRVSIIDENGKKYILKESLNKSFDNLLGDEYRILKIINSKYGKDHFVPRIYGEFNNRKIKMEYINGATLNEYCQNHSKLDIFNIMLSLADKYRKLEKINIHHKDIKADNILINGKKAFIIDFNASNRLGCETPGTDGYIAPELNGSEKIKPFDTSTDIFSFGVMLYNALSDKIFDYDDKYNRKEHKYDWRSAYSIETAIEGFSNEAIEGINFILKKALMHDPKERYKTFEGLYNDLKKVKGKLYE